MAALLPLSPSHQPAPTETSPRGRSLTLRRRFVLRTYCTANISPSPPVTSLSRWHLLHYMNTSPKTRREDAIHWTKLSRGNLFSSRQISLMSRRVLRPPGGRHVMSCFRLTNMVVHPSNGSEHPSTRLSSTKYGGSEDELTKYSRPRHHIADASADADKRQIHMDVSANASH